MAIKCNNILHFYYLIKLPKLGVFGLKICVPSGNPGTYVADWLQYALTLTAVVISMLINFMLFNVEKVSGHCRNVFGTHFRRNGSAAQ
jgi:multisubunit Na+/H+ antiporter MnhC subunit